MSRLHKGIGHLEQVTITYPTPTEYYNPSGTLLPLTEPASSQVSYTIQQSDLPIFSDPRARCQWSAVLIVGGKNNIAASKTLMFRILKNGASVYASTSNSVSSNYYWTLNSEHFFDAKVGDTIEARFWCTSDATSLDWRYSTFYVRPTRFFFGDKKDIFFDFGVASSVFPTLTAGVSPFLASYPTETNAVSPYYLYVTGLSGSTTYCTLYNGQTVFALVQSDTYGLAKTHYGDHVQDSYINTSSTYMPYYGKLQLTTQFQFRRSVFGL